MEEHQLEKRPFESEVCFKLKEAESEAKMTDKRFAHNEVFSSLRRQLQEKADA